MENHYRQPIDERLAFIEKKIDSLMLNQERIKTWLIGDRDDGNELNIGALAEIITLKLKISKLERLKERVVYIIIGMAMPAGIGIGRLIEILKHTQ